ARTLVAIPPIGFDAGKPSNGSNASSLSGLTTQREWAGADSSNGPTIFVNQHQLALNRFRPSRAQKTLVCADARSKIAEHAKVKPFRFPCLVQHENLCGSRAFNAEADE